MILFISMIAFELLKRGDYADLKRRLGEPWMHFSIDGPLRIGLNGPPGLPCQRWINLISTLYASRAGLVNARITLSFLISTLVAAMNSTPVGPLLFPDWEAIYTAARFLPWKLVAWKEPYLYSLLSTLKDVIQASGELFCTFSGLDLERDIVQHRKCAVIDLANLAPPWLKYFVVDLLVAQLLLGRIERSHRTDTTEVMLFMDEGHELLSRHLDEQFAEGASIETRFLQTAREYGLAGVVGVQVPGKLSPLARVNFQYEIVGSFPDSDSAREAQRTLNLLHPEASQQFVALRPGQMIFRESQGSWPHAMLVDVDYVASNRMPPPQEYDSHPFIPSKPLDELPKVMDALDQLIAEHKNGQARRAREKRREDAQDLSDHARKLLDLWSLRPYTPVARLWDQLGKPAASVQASVREELERRGLAEFEEQRVGKRNLLFMELTDKGWRFLGKTPLKRKGRGGIAHRHYCHAILRYEKGLGNKARLEARVPGTSHPADVAAWRRDGLHVYEVVSTQEANLGSHLHACFLQSDQVATAAIAAPLKRDLVGFERTLDGDLSLLPFRSRITFEPMEKYL